MTNVNRRSILCVSATIALGLALFGITAGTIARAAEIKLLCAVAMHPAIDALIPDFEKSSGHEITVAYGNAGAIADRFQKGEAAGGGASGIYLAGLLERLGIAGEMKPKTTLSPAGKVLYASVASGDIEIGFNQISEVLAQPTVEFVGPLPPAIQNYTQFAPGIVTGSKQTDAAKALVTFLSSPAAQTVIKTNGFE